MERVTFQDKEVIARADRFVWVHVDVDNDPTVAERLGVEYIPDTRILSPQGDELDRKVGFETPAQFVERMERALTKAAGGPSSR